MNSFIDPAILFFVFGVLAGALRSNLEIPRSIAKFFSLYLLMALGLKGGFALAQTGLTPTVVYGLAAALLMSFLVPAVGFVFLRRFVTGFDAAAVSAAYGSVSAVTFVTAVQFLENSGLNPGGHMTVAMVIMESPAIIMAVLLANMLRQQSGQEGGTTSVPRIGKILHESFTDGAHLLLLGAMAIGWITGEAGQTMMQPFSGDLFKGMLAFFLLDMGLLVAHHFRQAIAASKVLLAYAVISPFVHATIALGLAALLGLPLADAVLLMVLSASASYIVVPAVLRYAIPEANPALYFGLSLGITFPINILVGIPIYAQMASWSLS